MEQIVPSNGFKKHIEVLLASNPIAKWYFSKGKTNKQRCLSLSILHSSKTNVPFQNFNCKMIVELQYNEGYDNLSDTQYQ